MAADLFRDHGGKAFPIHRQAATGFHPGGLRALQDQAAAAPQLLFQQADRILQPVTPEGVGADQLREIVAVVGRTFLMRLHFIQRHLQAPLGQLPRRFRTGKAGADHFYFTHLPASVFFVVLRVVFLAVFLAGFFSPSASVFLV